MARKETIKGSVIKKYLERFPNSPILTISKKIYNENKAVFKDVEDTRRLVNYYKGRGGKQNRESIKDKRFIKPLEYKYNPFEIPESHNKKAEVWKLPKAYKNVLVLSDIHFPFHDEKALLAALKYGQEKKVDAIFLNGDILDFYQLSFHEKDPRKVSFKEEIEMGRQFLAMLRRDFPGTAIYYIPGNHEVRLERFLRVKAPELLDMQEWKMESLLRFGENGVVGIEHGSKCYFGKLLVEHGDKMKGAGGVNPARTLSLKFKRHTICGHFHRSSESNSSVYDDDYIMCWSTGCLCDLEPDYLPLNEWNHGAAIIQVDHKTDEFHVENFKIMRGKVY